MRLPAFATGSVTLAWNASADPIIVGYNMYYGVASGIYTNEVRVGNVTNVTISGLVGGTTYYFAATADDAAGLESPLSNEVSYTVPATTVNQPPTLNALGNLAVNENAGLQIVNLSGITSGASSEVQTLTVKATSSNPGLIPNPTVNYVSPDATGFLTFTPATNVYGKATITVTVNNGQARSNVLTRTFTITVNAVNQPPTLNPVNNLVIRVNAGKQTIKLSGISSGAANEKQTLKVTATTSNRSVIPAPGVRYTSPNTTGTLTFTPAGLTGTAAIAVTVNDGGKSNNIITRTFLVTVVPKNASTNLAIASAITSPLTDFVAVAGQTVTFGVTATGTGPLTCQWQFDSTSLSAATNAVLTLNNLTANQAGAYSMTV